MTPHHVAHMQATAYLYDHFPLAPLSLNQPPGYGAMTSYTVSSIECCGVTGVAQSTVTALGARAIKITNTLADFLHLVEVEV